MAARRKFHQRLETIHPGFSSTLEVIISCRLGGCKGRGERGVGSEVKVDLATSEAEQQQPVQWPSRGSRSL